MAVDEKKPEAAAAEATEDANGDQEGVFKGQLISKCFFGIFNSSKKRTKKFDLTTLIPQVELFLFVFGRIQNTKKDIWKLTDL